MLFIFATLIIIQNIRLPNRNAVNWNVVTEISMFSPPSSYPSSPPAPTLPTPPRPSSPPVPALPTSLSSQNREVIEDALAYSQIRQVRWSCVVDAGTVRIEYIREDKYVARIELINTSVGWKRSGDVVTSRCPDEKPQNTLAFEIAVPSMPRRTADYFSSTIRAISTNFPNTTLHVVTVQPDRLYTPWTEMVDVHILNVAPPSLRLRSIAMYEYAMSLSSTNVMVIEDDVLVHTSAYSRFQEAIMEISINNIHDFVLDCYVVSWQGHKSHKRLAHFFYEDDYGCCTQCMYFTRNTSQIIRAKMSELRKGKKIPDPYDFIVHYTSTANQIPILGVQRALVQHSGKLSTGLGNGGYHQTNRFV